MNIHGFNIDKPGKSSSSNRRKRRAQTTKELSWLQSLDKQLLENLSSKHWLTYGQINRLTEKVELV